MKNRKDHLLRVVNPQRVPMKIVQRVLLLAALIPLIPLLKELLNRQQHRHPPTKTHSPTPIFLFLFLSSPLKKEGEMR